MTNPQISDNLINSRWKGLMELNDQGIFYMGGRKHVTFAHLCGVFVFFFLPKNGKFDFTQFCSSKKCSGSPQLPSHV